MIHSFSVSFHTLFVSLLRSFAACMRLGRTSPQGGRDEADVAEVPLKGSRGQKYDVDAFLLDPFGSYFRCFGASFCFCFCMFLLPLMFQG